MATMISSERRTCPNCYWEEHRDDKGNYPKHCDECTDDNDFWTNKTGHPKPLTKQEIDYMANSRMEHMEMELVTYKEELVKREYEINILNTHIDRIWAALNVLRDKLNEKYKEY